jgi:hypothetical protein
VSLLSRVSKWSQNEYPLYADWCRDYAVKAMRLWHYQLFDSLVAGLDTKITVLESYLEKIHHLREEKGWQAFLGFSVYWPWHVIDDEWKEYHRKKSPLWSGVVAENESANRVRDEINGFLSNWTEVRKASGSDAVCESLLNSRPSRDFSRLRERPMPSGRAKQYLRCSYYDHEHRRLGFLYGSASL